VRRPRAIRAAAWGVVVAGVLAPPLRRRLRLRPPVVAAASYAVPVALAVALPRTRVRDVVVVATHMWAYVAMYEMPNDDPEALERRVHVDYPVRVDRVLGLGDLPGVRLQRALARVGKTTFRDGVLVWAHWIWFTVPHGTAAYLLWRHPGRFPRSAAQIYAVFDLGVLVYWALPTAPPWYAARHGAIDADPALRRLMVEHGETFWRDRWDGLYGLLGGNPLAAMPSLHFATSVMAALVLADAGPVEGAVGWTYALTLGFALVYLGEHYVIDLLAGLGLTLAIRRLQAPATPLLLRASRAVQALEARAGA
jgi:hypothetical protein